MSSDTVFDIRKVSRGWYTYRIYIPEQDIDVLGHGSLREVQDSVTQFLNEAQAKATA